MSSQLSTLSQLRQRLLKYVRDPLLRADQEALETLQQQGGRIDLKTLLVLITTAFCMTLQNYGFRRTSLLDYLGWVEEWWPSQFVTSFHEWAADPANSEIGRLLFWALGQWIVYVVIPVFVIKVLLRERLRDYGLRSNHWWEGIWLYAGMMVVMAPLVYYFSTTQSFQNQYPFYHKPKDEPLWPNFIIWEIAYASQFVALEFFFRGFVLHGTRHRLGSMAIPVMTVPYCMIHFGKPWPETLGAIGAGMVLGFMSLKSRVIWLGAALHIGVAWSMDWLALSHHW